MHTAEKKSGALVFTFPDINPINNIEKGIEHGHYTCHYCIITDKAVPLQSAQGAKNLHLVCFSRAIMKMEYIELLRAEGKQPCRNSPNYLLGLMARVSEGGMPEGLCSKSLVAVEPDNESSFFPTGFKRSRNCFLCVVRRGVVRELSLFYVGSEWDWDESLAFLAEDLAL